MMVMVMVWWVIGVNVTHVEIRELVEGVLVWWDEGCLVVEDV